MMKSEKDDRLEISIGQNKFVRQVNSRSESIGNKFLVALAHLPYCPGRIIKRLIYVVDERREQELISLRSQYEFVDQESFVTNLKPFSLVSFDFYDTLVCRLAATPTDVLQYIGYILIVERRIPSSTKFLSLRLTAEEHARKAKSSEGDVKLQEIYDVLLQISSWPSAAIDRAYELELSLEHKALVPRLRLTEIACEAATSGKSLIIVSDTYMDSDFVRSMLHKTGLDINVTNVLCSCEVGHRKDNGSIWNWLKLQANTSGTSFVHFGGNPFSDVYQPKRHGLQAIGVISTAELADLRGYPMPTNWRQNKSDWRSGIILGPAIAAVGNNPLLGKIDGPIDCKTSYDFGYLVLGPLMFSFMSWLIRKVRDEQVKDLFFLARDGYSMLRIYKKIAEIWKTPGLPNPHYLYVSRRSVLPATMYERFDPMLLINGYQFNGTLGQLFLARFGVEIKEVFGTHAAEELISLPQDNDKVRLLVLQYKSAVVKLCEESNRSLVTYLSRVGFLGCENKAVVDIGYSGTIQKCLQIVGRKGLTGCYMMTDKGIAGVKDSGGRAFNCFADGRGSKHLSPVRIGHLILEAVLTAPHGQVSGYELDENAHASPIYTNNADSGAGYELIQEVVDGVERYCVDLISAYGPEILLLSAPQKDIQEPFRAFLRGKITIPIGLRKSLVIEDEFCGAGIMPAM